MNQTTLVQIAERLEGLAAKLPEKIRRPVLRELVPLKQLFLQQRRPRFLFVGSSKTPMPEIIDLLFAPDSHQGMNVTLTPVHRWTEWTIPGHGTVSILDARDAGDSAQTRVGFLIPCALACPAGYSGLFAVPGLFLRPIRRGSPTSGANSSGSIAGRCKSGRPRSPPVPL